MPNTSSDIILGYTAPKTSNKLHVMSKVTSFYSSVISYPIRPNHVYSISPPMNDRTVDSDAINDAAGQPLALL